MNPSVEYLKKNFTLMCISSKWYLKEPLWYTAYYMFWIAMNLSVFSVSLYIYVRLSVFEMILSSKISYSVSDFPSFFFFLEKHYVLLPSMRCWTSFLRIHTIKITMKTTTMYLPIFCRTNFFLFFSLLEFCKELINFFQQQQQ